MDALIPRYCLSLLLLTSIVSSAASNGTSQEETREPRVSGRIVKLYSGAKPEPYLCPGEGFQPDPSNCAVFYRCVKERSGKFSVFRYQCAPGTVYDPDLETCNHPHSTRRSECGGMLRPTVEPFHTANSNEIDGAQSEVPRPISTKVPTYTEHTTNKNPTTLSWILSTEHHKTPSKTSQGSTIYSTSSTIDANDRKTTELSSSSGYWSSSIQNQLDAELNSKITPPPKPSEQTDLKNNDPCTFDGFMGDSNNCRKFYRCVSNQKGGYVKYEFSCSELTIWDDEIQGCNHPWAVKRSKCGRSLSFDEKSTSPKHRTDSTEIPTINYSVTSNRGYGHKLNKTTQQQLQISHGSKVTQTQVQISNSPEVIQNQTQINYGNKMQNIMTSESKQNQTQISYDSAISQTQTQMDYGSKGIQTQLQINHFKDSSQSQVQVQEYTTIKPASDASTQNNEIGKSECSESGFMGDVNDCKKFYRCVDNGRGSYTKFEYICGDGTVWDPEIEACNHAWAVKNCGGKLPSESTAEAYTTTIKSTEYHTDKTTESVSLASQFPEDGEDVGYGNQNNQDTTSTSTEPTTTSTTIKPTSTTTVKSNETSTKCTSTGFIGDANDCKIFYRCVDNGNGGFTKHQFKCGDGTLWDSDIEACNHAWAVKNCGENTSVNIDKEENTTNKETTKLPENIQTTVTLVQITTQLSTQIDDYDTGYGSQNHEPTTTTIKSTKRPVEEDNNKNNECKSSGFMGDENDCNKFYRCVDNGNGSYIRYEFTCGDGTVWDSEIEACNHAWAVEKCGGSINLIDNNGTSSESTYTTSGSDTSTASITQITKETEKPISTTTTSTTRTTIASSGISNDCSQGGFIGSNSDCKKFYRCVDNGDGSYTRYEFTCGEGTVWDPKIESCNHAWAVENCGTGSETTHTTQEPVMQDEENGYATPNYETSETLHTTSSTSSSTSTSTASTGTAQCNNSGFMGDSSDCKKFYRCVDNGKGGFDRYEFQCGEGTVWDGSIEACNHAWAVKNCGESISGTTHFQNGSTTQSLPSSLVSEDNQTEKTTTTTKLYHESEAFGDECKQEGFFGNRMDCTKFYRCVDDGKGGYTKYDFTCGEGTSWNQEIKGCDHTSLDRPCVHGSTSQVTSSTEPIYLNDDMDAQTTSTKATVSDKETSQTTQTTKKPQKSPGTCKSEGFYANPSDCKKFYRCVANGNGGFKKYDFDCGDGTVWNQDIQTCDYESADKTCFGTSTSQINASEFQPETTTNSYSTTKKQETDTGEHETADTADSQCTSEGFFAHPNNCKKFIRCVNNGNGGYTRYEFSCGDGTVWVQEIQACDHDNDVTSCSSQSESTTSLKPILEEHSTSTLTPSTVFSTESMTPNREDDEYDTGDSKEPSHDESDDCTMEGYFANKQDCRKFYRCVNNGNGGFTKYDFVCGDGTAWDSNLQTCNHINEVQSCSDSTQAENGNHETTTNKNQGETESSSSTTKATTSATSESSSGSTANKQDVCESEGYYGNSKDCKKFYRCVDNGKGGYTKYDFTCGDGTIWDQDITACNHPQDVSNRSCSSNQENSVTSSTTSTTTSSSGPTTSNTTGSSSNQGTSAETNSSTTESSSSQSTSDCSQESSEKPANNNVTCDKAGYYANPNDCKKFYRCVDWDGDGKRFSVFHFECGEGTIWDPALDTCNHEDSVYPPRDCSQTQSQNVGGETTTTEKSSTSTTTTETNIGEPTTEQTTTQQSTTEQSTNEPTTTQQSTTSEKTTTQESTTSEQTTTQQPTTSEKTTTQESTTTEQTTTQQSTTTHESTTGEQTTAQESTSTTTEEPITKEPTTTQQTTTSEQTTTQQSTTSEQTTTQQSTTSEQTTTQLSTTSEQTTTQQYTTSESTTIQQSTTSEQTTTQQSTTNEQTTPQELTTSEQTTTQQSTTDYSTTQESATSEQTTTQESTTTDQTTTQDSNTSEQTTTQQSTTTEQTTESSTATTEQTIDGTTTTEETTEQSSTQTSSTESDSTEEQSSTETPSTTTATSSFEKECPETEDDQYLLVCPTSFRRHPKYCNMFYQCTEDEDTYEAKMAMFKCPNNTIYDETQTQCVTEDKADKKCEGEIANKRRFKRLGFNYKDPIVADKGKLLCSTAGYFAFDKQSECAKGFLKCERSKNGQLKGYVYQCPQGYTYWSISKRCERIESVRDCKGSSNDWTERWNIPIERKNVAAS